MKKRLLLALLAMGLILVLVGPGMVKPCFAGAREPDIGPGYWATVPYPDSWCRWRGDCNRDGVVSFPDYLILEGHWGEKAQYYGNGTIVPHTPLWSHGNFMASMGVGDGIGMQDFMCLENNFLNGPWGAESNLSPWWADYLAHMGYYLSMGLAGNMPPYLPPYPAPAPMSTATNAQPWTTWPYYYEEMPKLWQNEAAAAGIFPDTNGRVPANALVPEPVTVLLLLGGFALMRRRNR